MTTTRPAKLTYLEMGADTLTPVTAFLRLRKKGEKAFLLESVEGGERMARFSFLGVNPVEVLRVKNGEVFSQKSGKKQKLDGNPMAILGEHLAKYQAGPPLSGLPPFQGGAVGFVGYDCVRYLEDIPSPAIHKSDGDEAVLMFFRSVVAFDHVLHRVVVMTHRLSGSDKISQAAAKRECLALQKRLLKRSADETPFLAASKSKNTLPKAKSALGKKAFTEGVAKIKKHIRRGDIFQCVLSERFEFPLSAEPFAVYRALRALNPSPYMFYLDFGAEKLLGASPEMLVRAGNSKIQTCPIAGTRPRGKDEAEDKKFERDLLASVKERAEHLMLVDLGRNDLGRVAQPASVTVKDFMHIERFSHVMHLVTNVFGKLKKGKSPWDAFCAAFPAGTLTGAPKVRAMEILAGLEPVRRGAYGGAVVYHDYSGNLDSCITIRSLFAKNGKARVQAGAGIVADSQAAREYKEIESKALAVRRAAALAANSSGRKRK